MSSQEDRKKGPYWTTSGGRLLRVSKMQTSHLANLVRLVQRYLEKQSKDPWEYLEYRALAYALIRKGAPASFPGDSKRSAIGFPVKNPRERLGKRYKPLKGVRSLIINLSGIIDPD